jgi:hypothetical protein
LAPTFRNASTGRFNDGRAGVIAIRFLRVSARL